MTMTTTGPPPWSPGDPVNVGQLQFQIEPNKPADSLQGNAQVAIDVGGKANYALFAIMADGSQGMVPCSGLSWEEQTGEIATRITAQLPDDTLEDGRRLPDLITLGSQIAVLAALGDATSFEEVARGQVEELSPNDGTGGTFEIIAYDPIKVLLNSKIDAFYEAGLTPAEVIRRVCQDNSIPVGEITPQLDSVTFPGASVFHAQTLADVINKCVTDGQNLSPSMQRMVVRATKGQVSVIEPGNNKPVYWLIQGNSVVSVRQRISITDLVTVVQVTGKAPDANSAPPVVTTLTGELAATYGVRREIIALTQNVSADEVKAQALDVLTQKGQPRNDRSIVAPDVPMIRKFDQIRVTAGALNDYYSVESITHDEGARTMEIGLGNLKITPAIGVFADGLDKEIDESAIPPPSSTGTAGAVSGGALTGGNQGLLDACQKYLGVPYVLGGNSMSGIDCSAFVQQVYGSLGVSLPRTAQTQYNACTKVDTPQVGDLVFFKGTYSTPDYITHVGIYVGNGEMINAKEPVCARSSLNTDYWQSHLAGYGRVPGAAGA
jgi:hypothetical protein